MILREDFKKVQNNSLKEIQENMGQQVAGQNEETQKSCKITGKHRHQLKEVNKTIQDLKVEVETMKKVQRETTLEIEKLGKKSGVIDQQEQKSTIEFKR